MNALDQMSLYGMMQIEEFFNPRTFVYSILIPIHQFSPDGSVFVSASMDGNIFVFDGKTGEKTGALGAPAHKGGIYAVSFNANGSKLLSGKIH